MVHKIQMRRSGDRLECTSPTWADLFDDVPKGVNLNVAITKSRSLRQNSTYWGLLKFVINHGPEWIGERWPDKDHLSAALQFDLNYTYTISLFNGETRTVPESKDFDTMAQEKFNKYFEAVQVLLNEWCQFDALDYYIQWLDSRI